MKRLIISIFIMIIAISLAAEIDEYKWEYDVKFGMIKAGTGTMQIKSDVYNDSIPVYHILFKARTNNFFDTFYRVRDKIESWWHKEELIPLEFTKELKEGKYRQRRTHYYYHDLGYTMYYDFKFKKNKLKEKKMDILPDTQDILTAFFAVREKDLKVGDNYLTEITVDGKSFTANTEVLRKEKIKTEIGKKECFVIQPTLASDAVFRQKGNIFIWITDDEERIPVKVQSKISYGSFYATITESKKL